jgi:ankyrin repeat protein
VSSLLNDFDEDESKQLIQYLMKQNKYGDTTLHISSGKGDEEVVKLILNAFSEDEKEKCIEYLIKEIENKKTALGRKNTELVKLLLSTILKCVFVFIIIFVTYELIF